MNKKAASIVALGCICASAATSVNYDLLGRRGSQMNSPMVYKNIDYSKMKNDKKQLASPLETKALMKLGSGLTGDVVGLEGAYCNWGLDYTTNYPVPYYMKVIYSNGNKQTTLFDAIDGSNGYMEQSNQNFIQVPRLQNYSPSYITTGERTRAYETHYNLSEKSYSFTNANINIESHYRPGEMIHYMNLQDDVRDYLSGRSSIASWYDASNYGNVQEFGKVGVHMTVNALPVKLNNGSDVSYIRTNWNDQFNTTPQKELASARMYSTVKATAKNPVIYVGKNLPTNPASKGPQIYVGLHSGIDENGNNANADIYSTEARDLDNYIYKNRTIEIAAAGNYSVASNTSHLAAKAHAVNAITVGAIDPYTGKIAGYTSYVSKYCTRGLGNCPDGDYAMFGSRKPEVYNYAHFYLNDKKRTYTSWDNGGGSMTYVPLYDGTEMAAAYTAGMVADILTVNPFYRWHPEVVRALLLTSGYMRISGNPYPYNPVSYEFPTYNSLMFDKDHNDVYHYSRYWIGNVHQIAEYVIDGVKEFRFSVKRPANKTNFSAAIAWLTSGNDIAKLGKVPQDFDLYVYERITNNIDDVSGTELASSLSVTNAFEYVSFSSNAEYLLFRIRLYKDAYGSENRGQMVLGFDLAALRN